MVSKKINDLRTTAICLTVLVVVNVIAQYFFARIDFTTENRYSLTNITRTEVSSLDSVMNVEVYLEGDFPAGFKHLQRELKDLLSEYESCSGGKFRVRFINPAGGASDAAESFRKLSERGLEATRLSVKSDEGLSQKIIFPGALLDYKGRQIAVNFFQNKIAAPPEEVLNNSVQNLEYAFTSAIAKLKKGERTFVGFTEGHGELGDEELADAMSALRVSFEPVRVDLKLVGVQELKALKLLIIARPRRAFSEEEKFKIDQYVMNGGRVLWSVDMVSAGLDSLRKGEALAYNYSLNLDDMLFRYGVRVNYRLVADMNCAQIPLKASDGAAQIQMVPWLFFPVIMPLSGHPVVKNLDGVRTEFVSDIDTVESKGIRKTVLLSSSPYNQVVNTPSVISLNMAASQPDPRNFKSAPKIVAVLLEGDFPSVFRNRPLPQGIVKGRYLDKAAGEGKMLVISDGDVFRNQINPGDSSPYPLGFDRYTGTQMGNRIFFLNAVDYLTDDSGLIALRSKELKIRLLDKARLRTEKMCWQILNIAAPLMLIFLAGLIHYLVRKKRILN